MHTMKFKCKSILPAIAIKNTGNMVEISKYEIIRDEVDKDDMHLFCKSSCRNLGWYLDEM